MDRLRILGQLHSAPGVWMSSREIRARLGLGTSVGVERILAQLAEHDAVQWDGLKGWRVPPLPEVPHD